MISRSECDKNVKEVVTKSFLFGPMSYEKQFGDHEWTVWSEPKFRCHEVKKIGKKDTEFGHSYQRRTCRHCGIVDECKV
jgi:hypothetical protein